MGVEETLQNQYRSYLVDHLAVPRERPAGGVEMPVRFSRRKALVPEVNGQRKFAPQGLSEGLGFCSLRAQIAGHIERIAEDDRGAAEFAQHPPQRLQVLLRVPANKRQHRLGGQAELVGDSDADAAVAKIEAQQAGFHESSIADGAAGSW